LREKVNEALAVFNDYVKTQSGDGAAHTEANGTEQSAAGGEEAKA